MSSSLVIIIILSNYEVSSARGSWVVEIDAFLARLSRAEVQHLCAT